MDKHRAVKLTCVLIGINMAALMLVGLSGFDAVSKTFGFIATGVFGLNTVAIIAIAVCVKR